MAGILLVLSALLVSMVRSRVAVRQLRDVAATLPQRIRELNSNQVLVDASVAGLSRVLPHSANYDWDSEVDRSDDVTIIRLRLNLGERVGLLRALEGVLDRNGFVTLVISDPRCPAMWLRYMEEPKLDATGAGSESAWTRGLEELALEVARLDTWTRGLITTGRNTDRLRIKLSARYPGQAFMRLDQRIYMYNYPYLQRGYHGPAFAFESNGSQVFNFLESCMNLIVGSADPLDREAVSDIAGKYRLGLFSDRVVERSAVRIGKLTSSPGRR
jgi:hypothetical protein